MSIQHEPLVYDLMVALGLVLIVGGILALYRWNTPQKHIVVLFTTDYHVEKFQLYGDGWHDDTGNIQRAMSAAKSMNGAILYFPPGEIKTAIPLPEGEVR